MESIEPTQYQPATGTVAAPVQTTATTHNPGRGKLIFLIGSAFTVGVILTLLILLVLVPLLNGNSNTADNNTTDQVNSGEQLDADDSDGLAGETATPTPTGVTITPVTTRPATTTDTSSSSFVALELTNNTVSTGEDSIYPGGYAAVFSLPVEFTKEFITNNQQVYRFTLVDNGDTALSSIEYSWDKTGSRVNPVSPQCMSDTYKTGNFDYENIMTGEVENLPYAVCGFGDEFGEGYYLAVSLRDNQSLFVWFDPETVENDQYKDMAIKDMELFMSAFDYQQF
ncbi:MAG: hypothetical protein TR69_WS6001000366 [candidate division WS6 bacterium OLB20]|uniref:Uncharacterized protein n=1 Tax=candidate division WS6 bacterium OLB20 TaxID=1617426 RepID=A0A136M0P9_9BACT|nr:MAG: hypothetical protein TR69_WS6001000366 [candidate division WS6 bacterium OLB20]